MRLHRARHRPLGDSIHVTADILRIGYVGWVFLATGLVMLLHAAGRGRRRWEPATLIVVAVLPPVWLSVESSFHPQDLLALGLALAAMACALEDRWLAAGVVVTLAFLSQEFALLVAVPLLFLAPAGHRLTFLGGVVGTGAVALVALLVGSSPRLVWDALFGSIYQTTSDTLVMTLHLKGTALVFVSRIVPVLLSAAISWGVVRSPRLRTTSPTVLVSLVAVSLGLRLVFEQNTFGYYYMALAVTLIVLDVVDGRVRTALVAWLVMVSLTYLVGPTTTFIQLARVSWGNDAQQILAPATAALALVLLALGLRRRASKQDLLVWLAVLCGCLLVWPSGRDPVSWHVSKLFWQIVLVAAGMVLAARPLLATGAPANAAPRTKAGGTPARDAPTSTPPNDRHDALRRS